MPVPVEHLQALDRSIENEGLWISLVESQEFRSALDALHDDPDALDNASRDPARYLSERGVRLPDGVVAEVYTSRRRQFKFEVCRDRWWFDDYCCTGYDSNRGFYRWCVSLQ